MKGLALLGVLIIAKLAMLAGRPIQPSGWAPLAYFWQDLLVALAFALLDRLLIRFKTSDVPGWILYGAAVAYVAINVPVARVLSSPLTWPMLGATRGALSDSIKHHATAANLSLMFLVLTSGVALPLFLRRTFRRLRWKSRSAPGIFGVILAALILAALGPLATSRVDTVGMGRNAITALATTALPRITARAGDVEAAAHWRAGPLGNNSQAEDLSELRGAASGRNVILILLESAGAQYVQQYLRTPGGDTDPMPNLSELAGASVIFENAYSVYPESIKGFFSVLCSRYPAMDTEAESYGRITTPSIAAALNQAGYRTALFHSGRFMYLGMEAVVENRGYEVLEDAGAIGGNRESSFGVDEPSTVRRALAWIDSLKSGERFFLTYLPIAGHHPYDTPEPGPFPERTESDRYLNALYYADQSLGGLIKGLRERGLEERTLFVIFGDHGEAFGQHEGNFGHSLFLYDENIRVPYLIAAPGLIKEPEHVTRPISLIDTAPTILDLIGSTPPAGYQGLSALEGQSSMALFYTDYSLSLMGLRDGCWKYIYELESDRSKLFDLCADAAESTDRSSLYADRVAAYRVRLSEWASAQKSLMKGTGDTSVFRDAKGASD
ncbi:MAG TPA: sulfatase [Blastocatellia bacterium]|nr:sulfatase [Blastocatellia bacterium]